MVIDPVNLSGGTSESQGKYIWKSQPVLYSQKTDPIMQDKHNKKRNSTIWKRNLSRAYILDIRYYIWNGVLHNYPENEKVEQLIDVRALKFWFSWILHELCIFSCKDHHTITPFCVFQNASS